MPLFRRNPAPGAPFRKNERVVATVAMRGVPEGTQGRVKLTNGFDWVRHWVFFENGVDLGSIDAGDLVRPQHWEQFKLDREAKILADAAAAEAAANAPAGEVDSASAEVVAADPNDPLAALRAMVPPRLLELSAAARIRLGVPKS